MAMIRPGAICEALLPGLRQEDVRWGLEVLNVELQDDNAGVIVEFAEGSADAHLRGSRFTLQSDDCGSILNLNLCQSHLWSPLFDYSPTARMFQNTMPRRIYANLFINR